MVKVFLYAPQDFRNLCAIARTLEVLGHTECFLFDRFQLVRERYGKARLRQLRDVSGGAFEKLSFRRVEEPERFLASFPGRVVATVADARAQPLERFGFSEADLLLFGGESRGLPADITALAAATVTIASRGRTQSLNLAVALGVAAFEAHRQLLARPGSARAGAHG